MAVIDDNKLFIFKDECINNLTDLDNDKIFCGKSHIRNFSKIDGNIYHVKKRNKIIYIINELIGEIVSEYFELNTVKSLLARNEDKYYILLTKLFTDNCDKCSIFDSYLFPNVKLKNVGLDNLNRLRKFIYNDICYKMNNNNLNNLKNNIKKMVVRDFITNQTDRHNYNFLFSVNEVRVELLPLFDYEHSFNEDIYRKFYNYFNFDLSLKKVIKYIRKDKVFQELLVKAMELDVLKIIRQLEEEYPIKLDSNEIFDYKYVIKEKQDEIKEFKLLR